MKKKSDDVWTVVYKDHDEEPRAYSYYSKIDAETAKLTIEKSNGTQLVNEKEEVVGHIHLDWVYLIQGRLFKTD
ncbi:hypothetical protein P4T89_12455 [Bacillus nakamurai]|uniref:Uncharacterized protein n=1 Tax=Bacillus nakamurai TaxID=1793963 RepID=A0A150FAV2_9BACI|nr:hypothetical protein [Bacillus nakamurai]KXZ22439.1 hypothetical protein AXI58_10680 [Bacillus nakamurai]MED1228332.1 hypothetical protein [Bacillus nakamurai]